MHAGGTDKKIKQNIIIYKHYSQFIQCCVSQSSKTAKIKMNAKILS